MTPRTTLPLPTISPEVRAFAVEKGVEDYLPGLLDALRRLFPHFFSDVVVEDDPELSYNRQIVFEVDATGSSADERGAAHWQWTEDVFSYRPATHVHVFCLVQR